MALNDIIANSTYGASNMTSNNQAVQTTQKSAQTSEIESKLGSSVNGTIVAFENNRVILDLPSNDKCDKFLELTLKQNVPNDMHVGDKVTVRAAEISDFKFIPKTADLDGKFDLKQSDADRQILFNLKLPFDQEHVDMLNILKDNGMAITRENVNKLISFKNKLQYIVDNATPAAIENLASIKSIDTESIDSIFKELKDIADSIPLGNEEINNLNIDEIINNLKDINPDEEKLKDIVSAVVKNNLPPTKNNVSRVDTILKNVDTIKDLSGKTIGYIVKNNIELTINNLMKAKLSFDNLGNIMGNYRGATSGAYLPSSISGTVPVNSTDIEGLSGDINKILTLEGLATNEENISAAKILIQNDMDISRKNITSITSLIDSVEKLSDDMDADTVVKLIKENVDIPNTKIDALINYAVATKETPDNGKEFRLDSYGLKNSSVIDEFFKAQSLKNVNVIRNQDITDAINSLKEVSLSDIASLLKDNKKLNPENLLSLTKNIDSSIQNTTDTQIKVTLASLKISATDENIAATKALINNNMNVSRNAIDKLLASKNYLDSFCDKASKNLNVVSASLPDNWKSLDVSQLKDISLSIAKTQTSSSYDTPASNPLKLKLDTKVAEENIKDILKSLDLPTNDVNLKAAKALISSGIDITKDSIAKASTLIVDMKDLSNFKPNEILATIKYINDVLNDSNNSNLKGYINQFLKNSNIASTETPNLKDVFKLPVGDLLKVMQFAKNDILKNGLDMKAIAASAEKSVLDEITTNINGVVTDFTKLVQNLKDTNYKSVGFLFRNGIVPNIKNMIYAKSILLAKDSVNLQSAQNLIPNKTDFPMPEDLSSIEKSVAQKLIATQNAGLNGTIDSSNDFTNKNLSYPKQLPPAMDKAITENIKSVLTKMGLQANDENIEIAKSLIENTLNVNKNSLVEMIDIKKSLNDLLTNSNYIKSLPNNWQDIDIRTLSNNLENLIQHNPEQLEKRNFKYILSDMLKQVNNIDNDTVSFMVKNNIPFTLKNAYTSKMFLEDQFILGKQIESLKAEAEKSGDTNLIAKTKDLLTSFISKSANIKSLRENPSEVYEDIKNMVKQLTDYAGQNAIKNSTSVSKLAYDINSNLDLQQNLNLTNTLLQMPLAMNGQLANLQLYVMNNRDGNGKKKSLDVENMEVFLHLNTMNIGTVDTFLNFKNKTLKLRFGVENDDALKLVETSKDSLVNILNNLGFDSVGVSSFLRNEDINVMNAKETFLDDVIYNDEPTTIALNDSTTVASDKKAKISSALFDFKA